MMGNGCQRREVMVSRCPLRGISVGRPVGPSVGCVKADQARRHSIKTNDTIPSRHCHCHFPSPRILLTISSRRSSIRFCPLSNAFNRLSHSKLPNVASFSAVSSAVSGSHDTSER